VDPVLTCPLDVELAVDGACLAQVPEMSASVTDNCDILPNTPTQGGETVTLGDDRSYVFTSSDTSGNSASCDVSITVVDNIVPLSVHRRTKSSSVTRFPQKSHNHRLPTTIALSPLWIV
jgi:hypothetical protein